jgi:hypothetical protein
MALRRIPFASLAYDWLPVATGNPKNHRQPNPHWGFACHGAASTKSPFFLGLVAPGAKLISGDAGQKGGPGLSASVPGRLWTHAQPKVI